MIEMVTRLRQTQLTCQVLALRMQVHQLACQQVQHRHRLRGHM